jgi:hypothetical protein
LLWGLPFVLAFSLTLTFWSNNFLFFLLIGVNMSKIKVFPNGYATLEKLFPSGMYLVQCYKGTELHDKIRCDDYRSAMDYYKAFTAIAKTA